MIADGTTQLVATTPALPEAVRARTAIIIAAYNEAGAIASVVRELRVEYPTVIVVDDGSSDDTAKQARGAGAIVLEHFVNRGQGAALQTGITYALERGAEIIVTFDADGQHDVADLPAMIEPIACGDVHICLGSRFLEKRTQIPVLRRLTLRGAILFMRLTSRMRLTDAHNGFRAFSRDAARGVDLQLDRMAHASEIVDQFYASGLSYREVPVRVRYTEYSLRKGQKSSAALRVAFDYLLGRLTR